MWPTYLELLNLDFFLDLERLDNPRCTHRYMIIFIYTHVNYYNFNINIYTILTHLINSIVNNVYLIVLNYNNYKYSYLLASTAESYDIYYY